MSDMRAIALAALALSACSESVPAPSALKAEAEAYIQKSTESPVRLEFRDAWISDAIVGSKMVCGEYKAPPSIKEAVVRYYYNGSVKHGQAEMHSGWVTYSSVSQSIIDTNRRLFNDMWANHCEENRPGRLF